MRSGAPRVSAGRGGARGLPWGLPPPHAVTRPSRLDGSPPDAAPPPLRIPPRALPGRWGGGRTRPRGVGCATGCDARGGRRGGAGPGFHVDSTPFPLPPRAVGAPVADPAGNATRPLGGRWAAAEPWSPPTPRVGLALVRSAPRQMLMSAGGAALKQQNPRQAPGELGCPPRCCLGDAAVGDGGPRGWVSLPWLPLSRVAPSSAACHACNLWCVWRRSPELGGHPSSPGGDGAGAGEGGWQGCVPPWGCKARPVAATASKITSALLEHAEEPVAVAFAPRPPRVERSRAPRWVPVSQRAPGRPL